MAAQSDLSRRQFLVQSAGLAGASLGLGATRAGASSEVRLGFIGVGDRGRQLLGAFLAAPSARVVAVADVNPLNLKRALDIAGSQDAKGGAKPRGFTNYRALLDAREVDAVVIATPVYLHHPHALSALAAGKHVYCEKPLALGVRECREVLAAAREAESRGQIYQSGLQRRYNPRYREGVRYLHEGQAGEVLFVRAQWHAVGAARKSKPWLHSREKSGDIVLEQASHQFDVFNWIFRSMPVAAVGMGGRNHPAKGPPFDDILDHYAAVLEYPRGAKVHFSHLSYSIPDRRFSGIYELVFCEKAGVDLANGLCWDGSGRTRELCQARGNETQLAVASFVGCLLHGRRPDADADNAYRAAVAAELCRRALDSGRRVSLEDVEA